MSKPHSPPRASGAKAAPVPPTPTTPVAAAPPSALSATAAYAGVALKPPAYDPVAAKHLLDTWRPRLDAIPPDKLAVPRFDVHAASLAVLGVYAFVTQVEPIHERFQQLAAIGEFRLATIEDMKSAAFLVLYAQTQAEAAGAFATDAKVPAGLIQEGLAVEERMQSLCEYKFKNDPEIAPQLKLLRPGSGHRDLAADLLGYADIYELRHDEVASDTTNYRPTDLADARRIAGEILSHLSAAMSPKAKEAYEILRKVLTVLLDTYFEVQETGRWLLRYDPTRDERFSSLSVAGRSGRPRKKKEPAAKPPEPTSPAQPPQPNGATPPPGN